MKRIEKDLMTEKQIESRLVKTVTEAGGIAFKFASTNMAGVPDRLILLPGGRVLFAEVKRPGAKPRPLQEKRHKQIRTLGINVLVVDDISQIHEVVKE